MRISSLLSALCAISMASATPKTVEVSIQPIEAAAKPAPLAEIAFDLASEEEPSIESYDAPDLPEDTKTVRIGLYDSKAKAWTSGTTVASVENFSKGYSPHIILSVDAQGQVVSAALKGVRIDAGQTRDFGPKAIVIGATKGTQPQLNKPIALSAEGKKLPDEPEKSFLQKYWWAIAIGAVVILGGAGGEK